MACCNAILERCDPAGPAGDNTVLIFVNSDGSPPVYKNVDGTDWAGDPTTLAGCAGGGSVSGLTVTENADGTVTVTHDPGDGSAPYTSTFSVGGSSTALNKVDADGVTTAFDPTTECISAAPIQRITDHHGDKITGGTTCAPEDVILHRSLVIGDDHVGGATGVGGAKLLGVSSLDSDDGPITGITTHHLNSVIASLNSDSTGTYSATIASQNSQNNAAFTGLVGASSGVSTGGWHATILSSEDSAIQDGNRTIIGSSNDSTIVGGQYSTILGSSNSKVDAPFSGVVIGSTFSESLGNRCSVISSENTTTSGVNSAAISSFGTTIDAGTSFAAGTQNSSVEGATSAAVASNNVDIVAGSDTSFIGASSSGTISTNTKRSAILATEGNATVDSINSAAIGGKAGIVDDPDSLSFSGGVSTVGSAETLAHGTPTGGGARPSSHVAFRGVVPAPPRVVATLADVILALQEQGLAS